MSRKDIPIAIENIVLLFSIPELIRFFEFDFVCTEQRNH